MVTPGSPRGSVARHLYRPRVNVRLNRDIRSDRTEKAATLTIRNEQLSVTIDNRQFQLSSPAECPSSTPRRGSVFDAAARPAPPVSGFGHVSRARPGRLRSSRGICRAFPTIGDATPSSRRRRQAPLPRRSPTLRDRSKITAPIGPRASRPHAAETAAVRALPLPRRSPTLSPYRAASRRLSRRRL